MIYAKTSDNVEALALGKESMAATIFENNEIALGIHNSGDRDNRYSCAL
jgi:hypothetical protein